jgi:hypothetical protein
MVLWIHGVVPEDGLSLFLCALRRGYGSPALSEPMVSRSGENKSQRQNDQDAKDDSLC